ncbi:CASP-like protein 5C2 [Striga hermonthica]|uniref:CASP-like protein n=1 Tax=Striga hermonthica TaxID=68872 RepID=A0A9N7R6V8_STRHE|nr:CASP-like protein 5C2 [Striga hermonthica]
MEISRFWGTLGSLGLRFGQAMFALASLLSVCMSTGFYNYSAFCFLVTTMGLVIPWSLTLAMTDVLSVYIRPSFQLPGMLSFVVIGDWVVSILSLAASCSAASVTDFLLDSGDSFCLENLCTRYQVAAAMALLSWFLLLPSMFLNLWTLTCM